MAEFIYSDKVNLVDVQVTVLEARYEMLSHRLYLLGKEIHPAPVRTRANSLRPNLEYLSYSTPFRNLGSSSRR